MTREKGKEEYIYLNTRVKHFFLFFYFSGSSSKNNGKRIATVNVCYFLVFHSSDSIGLGSESLLTALCSCLLFFNPAVYIFA